MNVGAHQEGEKNVKAGKREAEERKRTTNFKEAVCCSSVVFQGAAWQKK